MDETESDNKSNKLKIVFSVILGILVFGVILLIPKKNKDDELIPDTSLFDELKAEFATHKSDSILKIGELNKDNAKIKLLNKELEDDREKAKIAANKKRGAKKDSIIDPPE